MTACIKAFVVASICGLAGQTHAAASVVSMATDAVRVSAAFKLKSPDSLATESLASYTYAADLDQSEAPRTAVYDISAHVVVMPDGSRLEAHSGLAARADSPRFVREHMRGATPPALYELQPRPRLFHGVAALRLLPVVGDVFGRQGLLTHPYMLHGRPESNGCVVFRDYASFLRAYADGRIRRLRVVPAVGNMTVRGNDA